MVRPGSWVKSLHESKSSHPLSVPVSLYFCFLKWPLHHGWASQVALWQKKKYACQCSKCRRCRFGPRVGNVPQRRKWQATLAFLPGKSQGQRSPVGCNPQSHKELDPTEPLSMHAHYVMVMREQRENVGKNHCIPTFSERKNKTVLGRWVNTIDLHIWSVV